MDVLRRGGVQVSSGSHARHWKFGSRQIPLHLTWQRKTADDDQTAGYTCWDGGRGPCSLFPRCPSGAGLQPGRGGGGAAALAASSEVGEILQTQVITAAA